MGNRVVVVSKYVLGSLTLTRWSPVTGLVATVRVLMSTSIVRLVIQRQAPAVMPLPELMVGASARAPGAEAKTASASASTTRTTIHRARPIAASSTPYGVAAASSPAAGPHPTRDQHRCLYPSRHLVRHPPPRLAHA